MGSYVAFLRGMNLGKRRIKNDELCACFEAMGFEDVSAFLASGNVVFSTRKRGGPALERSIASGLKKQLDYDVPTFIRSAKDVAAIAGHAPFSATVLKKTAGKLQVMLLGTQPSAAIARKTKTFASAEDHLALTGRELYWLPNEGISTSELDTRGLEKLLGPFTVRTHRTLVRLEPKLAR